MSSSGKRNLEDVTIVEMKERALELLRRQYANGEIIREQNEQMKKDLLIQEK